jgi:2-polyprenyl-6-hydroxyphenyl methylase/3-demethylubiquinone-9 3-methyltransferase
MARVVSKTSKILGLGLRARVSRILWGADERTRPPTVEAWDAEYTAGRWAYLGQLPELARYSLLVGYLRHFKPGGAVLDVGCGEGLLFARLHPDDYRRYVGVDFSKASIEKARARAGNAPNAEFLVAHADRYEPTEKFDAIVFNEVLYYLDEPLAAVERCKHALNPGGVFLVSTSTASRGLDVLEALKHEYRPLDEVTVTHGENPWSWICTVLERRDQR